MIFGQDLGAGVVIVGHDGHEGLVTGIGVVVVGQI